MSVTCVPPQRYDRVVRELSQLGLFVPLCGKLKRKKIKQCKLSQAKLKTLCFSRKVIQGIETTIIVINETRLSLRALSICQN